MSWIGKLFKELLVDSDPDKPRPEMSLKQMYNYLISLRHRTDEEQTMLEELHRTLGKDKWD